VTVFGRSIASDSPPSHLGLPPAVGEASPQAQTHPRFLASLVLSPWQGHASLLHQEPSLLWSPVRCLQGPASGCDQRSAYFYSIIDLIPGSIGTLNRKVDPSSRGNRDLKHLCLLRSTGRW